jgi:hypothetical protein
MATDPVPPGTCPHRPPPGAMAPGSLRLDQMAPGSLRLDRIGPNSLLGRILAGSLPPGPFPPGLMPDWADGLTVAADSSYMRRILRNLRALAPASDRSQT